MTENQVNEAAKKSDKEICQELKSFYEIGTSYYTHEQRRARLLDATDKTELWKALRAVFPPYQILPDTNFVRYIKNNLLASLYTVMKSAEVVPTSEDDKQICMDLNIALTKIWETASVGFFQFQAGERAALLNLGITQVGWSENLTGGNANNMYKSGVTFKNVDPMKFMRDPFASGLETSHWCCTYDSYHKSVFERNPKYKEGFKEFLRKRYDGASAIPQYDTERPVNVGKDYYNLIIFWVREGKQVHEYHTIDALEVIYKKEDIKPSAFPFALLYCNLPTSHLIGISEPAGIFANNVAMNMLDSIALTSEYKNQRPPKFINSSSGLNINAFTKHGDEADRTFVVNGDASKAVHYHEFPLVSPVMNNLRQNMQYGMEQVTGVDGRYTGRDTGSIITTGGTEEMLNRVTLIDSPKILLYENYVKELTKLVLWNMLEFSSKRKYFYRKPNTTKWTTLEVDFPEIDVETVFDYQISISSELPKNKQRVAAMANMLMEKQMQYQEQGNSIQLITEEEWLMFQDLPNKEFMMERMGMQRNTDAVKEVSQVLFEYAGLTEAGMSPDQALLATADSLQQSRMGMVQPPGATDQMIQEQEMSGMGGL